MYTHGANLPQFGTCEEQYKTDTRRGSTLGRTRVWLDTFIKPSFRIYRGCVGCDHLTIPKEPLNGKLMKWRSH